MILKIKNKAFDFFENVTVNLRYDSVGSTYAFGLYFNPDNEDHKLLCRPGGFALVAIEHAGERLITGTLLSNRFRDSAVRELVQISGYSLPGVLEDSNIPVSSYPLQADGLSLQNIAEQLIKPFGLKIIIDPAVSSRMSAVYETSTAGHTQTIKSYLSELASQRNIFLTHDYNGNVVFTEAKTKASPIFDFTSGMPGVEFDLEFNGQSVHSEISLIQQATRDNPNAGQSSIKNPYAGGSFRPKVASQSSGKDNDTPHAVRNMLSEELKAVKLTIRMSRWDLNGKVVRPNSIITVTNSKLFLYQKTRFFIESVDLTGTKETNTAVLTCYLPEVYNVETPKNIFL